jgi:Tfp pilus assembly protein PilO
MTKFLDKLNLRPGERRLVVVVAIVVFLVLNVWLVWPSFGEWGRTEQRITDARKKVRQFQNELARRENYERQLEALKKLGSQVGSEDQASKLMGDVNSQALMSGVTLVGQGAGRGSIGSKTNVFFEEQARDFNVNSDEKSLVNFLWELGERNSLIRVRNMSIRRDPSAMRLATTLTLVASFQKKAPPRITAATPAASTPKTSAPPAKTSPPPKTEPVKASPAPTSTKPPVTNPLPKGATTPQRPVAAPGK